MFWLQKFSIWTVIVPLFRDIVGIYCKWGYNLINVYSRKGRKYMVDTSIFSFLFYYGQ